MLEGKGFYIWNINKCEHGDVEEIAGKAAVAHFSHVLIKIADGTDDHNLNLVPPLASELKKQGVEVWGWHFVHGSDPTGEAQKAIQRINALDLDGFVVNAEGAYKNKHQAADTYMRILKNNVQLPIALSSYRYPTVHHEFPWDEFLSQCDYNMPQVYWKENHNPGEQLRRCVREFQNLKYKPPIIPTGAAFTEHGWTATASDVKEFLQMAKSLFLKGANFWEWENCRTRLPREVWQTIRNYEWEPISTSVNTWGRASEGDAENKIVERYIQALNTNSNTQVAELYASDAAHILPKRTIQGKANISNWYLLFFNQIFPNAAFQLKGVSGSGSSRHITWTGQSSKGDITNGNDTIGIRNGKITYHLSHYTITQAAAVHTKYKVTAYSLNLRDKASSNSQVIGTLCKDDVVSLLNKSQDLYWFKIKTPWGLEGWASHKFLVPVQDGEESGQGDDPPWLRIAYQERGVKEYSGDADNPRIVEYHKSTTLNHSYANEDETAWCSSFVNWCMEKSNYEGTDSALARSWLNWGRELSTPRRGCIVVFQRPPNSSWGHVGFYISQSGNKIQLLGGNQSHEVNISGQDKSNLLSYRWPGNYEG